MNAIQPPRPPLQPKTTRRVARRPRRHSRRYQHKVMALETTAKLAVNILISAAAVSALMHLLPYTWSQQAKLQEIQTEVKRIEGRVNPLRTNFNRYFDPHQAKILIQEQSYRVDPKQRQVVFVDKGNTKVDPSVPSSP